MESNANPSQKSKATGSTVEVNVNGKDYVVNVRAYDTLSRVLREELGLFGVKRGCDYGGCGACTVSIDGRAFYSCMYPVQYVVGKKVLTVEGLSKNGEVSPKALSEIQNGFLENGGLQCGYCTPGIMMSTKCLLDNNPDPSLGDIQEALSGNICRCTGYGRIIESIFDAAKQRREKK
jgi:carbon-monoxide dehydrogenase small subunit